MSGVVRAVKRVFKKVVSVAKKIALPVLAVGALVFTGGAALGLLPAGVSWGGAVSAVTAKLGATGVLGSALTGAITQAGTGALIGGAISGITGGSVTAGLKAGATVGAITGGLISGASAIRNPAGNLIDGATGEIIAEGGAKTFPLNEGTSGAPESVNAAGQTVSEAAGGATQEVFTGTRKGLLSGVGSFIKENPEVSGGLIKGIGAGFLAGADSDAEADLLRTRHGLISSNFEGTDPGANFRSAAPSNSGQTPTERFNPQTYGSFSYEYNPKVGRIVKVPAGG